MKKTHWLTPMMVLALLVSARLRAIVWLSR